MGIRASLALRGPHRIRSLNPRENAMEATRWRLVKRLFQEALDRPEPDRSAFLAAACTGDPDLEAEVMALLSAHAGAGAFLATPTGDDSSATEREAASRVFERLQSALLGRYSLEREIGRGGMAIV